MNNQVENIQAEYKEKKFDMEWKYKSKIKSLEKENNHLHKVVDKFYETVEKFIDWICQKFGIGESKELVREFEKETNMYIDPEKQLKKEERAKEWDLEICFNANSQADTTKPLKEYSFLSNPSLALSTISMI